MKTMLDPVTRQEIMDRIQALSETSAPLWGKMNVGQMLKHCRQFDEMTLGKRGYKQSLLGKIFGQMALKGLLKDEGPMRKNSPTVPGFRVAETCDAAVEKSKWTALLQEYAHIPGTGYVHPFFGKLTKEQAGYLAYKHTDHHLRQFNA